MIASGFLTSGTAPLIRDFADIPGVSASTHEGAELLATNSGAFDAGFAICTKCGFADSMRRQPMIFLEVGRASNLRTICHSG